MIKNGNDTTNAKHREQMTQPRSKQFLHRPSSFFERMEMLFTMPSPGFGISIISMVMAAPMPVSRIPSAASNCIRYGWIQKIV